MKRSSGGWQHGFQNNLAAASARRVREIVTFIAEKNRPVAESFGLRVIAKVDLPAQFPELGKRVPEEQDEQIRHLQDMMSKKDEGSAFGEDFHRAP
jgi:hypothetical protein